MAAEGGGGDSAPLIVVTGASGFLASHVVHQLLAAGYRVRGTVRDPSNEVKTAPLKGLPGAADRLELVAADLNKDEGWDSLCDGAEALIHTASPFTLSGMSEEELMRGALGGVERGLAAAKKAGVKRVVMTSSVAATRVESGPMTEADWSDMDVVEGYPKSKTAAEKRAWELAAEEPKLDLTVINPSYIQGPTISRKTPVTFQSAEVFIMMLSGSLPYTLDINFMICDVRDVAMAHIRAMQLPETIGKRIICAHLPEGEAAAALESEEERLGSLNMARMGSILREHFGEGVYTKIPTSAMSHTFSHVVSLFVPTVRGALPMLGRRPHTTSTAFKDLLGFSVRDYRDSIVAMAEAVIRNGAVPDETPDKKYSGEDDAPPGIENLDLIRRK